MKNIIRLLGIVIFIIILERIDLHEILHLLRKTNILYILYSIFLFLPIHLITTWRWDILLRSQGIELPFLELLLAYAGISYLSLVTPARIGEFARATYLKKKGYSFSKSFFSVTVDRILDLFFISLLGLFGIILFLPSQAFKVSLVLAIIVLSIMFLFSRRDLLKKVLKFMIRHLVPVRYREGVKENLVDFYEDLRKLRWKTLFLITIGVLGTWILIFINRYLIALSLGIKISPIHLVTIIALVLFVNLLPISIFGIGTRDMTLIFFFGQIGLKTEEAVAFSTLILAMIVLNTFFYLVVWLIKPIEVRSIE